MDNDNAPFLPYGRQTIDDADIQAVVDVSIRPGEKLHKTMITAEESRHAIDIGDDYVIKPEAFHYRGLKSKPVPEGFSYNSGTNKQ
ncbi:hypothetical protein [uncultured Desulfovibrio sp.]|uniref:hypothetical protein n=1 Tax=uncultured Desulfovibrio sp. TaxID=167968 RepID=UPI00265F942C|nr:hypothetical protein [uncultured Desulfovibrio sp.]